MTIAHLVTHSGSFHADDLLSLVILTRLFPQAPILRTRDPVWIAPAPGHVIYDIGQDHDQQRVIFDHHQKNPLLREVARLPTPACNWPISLSVRSFNRWRPLPPIMPTRLLGG